ncbi:hypothetical protein DC083_08815 [Ignatzschineria ureiclastica]|uniref:DUF1190 domain-containing protein n=1 Tax=Ignatzschineria ureiclastica TaxID=472582 RepID=A0A2U2ACM6_9GAMM|nr:DUF1190 domain-containing protein [Ignatzschineria ureiclastica]PWD80408.1 hypothetical protein DC083_08815 [Ignatzschineria ureiclastica]GGZ99715.1 UPF0441 protein [Ignatzschineria ureiclastica]
MRKRTTTINLDKFRKKPKSLRLKPLAAIVATAFIVAACNNSDAKTEEVSMYRNVEECVRYNPDDKALCETTFAKAQQEALETAPRFTSREDCVAEFGENNCQIAPVNSENATAQQSSGSIWMPLMAGFLFGRMMSGFGAHKPLYAPQAGAGKGNLYDASGKNFGNVTPGSKVKVNQNDLKPGKPGQTLRRGGFGQMVSKQNMAASSAKSTTNSRSSSASSNSRRSFSSGG